MCVRPIEKQEDKMMMTRAIGQGAGVSMPDLSLDRAILLASTLFWFALLGLGALILGGYLR
jgi:hypothetical protein